VFKSKLRRVAGILKYKVRDCWPYKLKEIWLKPHYIARDSAYALGEAETQKEGGQLMTPCLKIRRVGL